MLPDTLQVAQLQALSGDPEDARRQALVFLEAADTADQNRAWARSILAQSTFDAATTTAQRVAAVRLMKENFIEAQSASLRAAIIDQISTAILDSQSKKVTEVVFSGEPFAAYKGETTDATIARLAEYSISIYPTASAYLMLARLEADTIMGSLYPGSSRLVETGSVFADGLSARAASIRRYVGQADALIDADVQRAAASPYGVTVLSWHHFWRGYALGVAARVDTAHLSGSEDSYRRVIDLAVSTRDAVGRPYPALSIIATKAELSYARMLHAVSGSDRAADVQAHLSRFVEAITADQIFYRAFYHFFDQAKAGAVATPDAKYGARYREYLEYRALADLSPELKTFLISRGWGL